MGMYRKLVHDLTPEIIRGNGQTPITRRKERDWFAKRIFLKGVK